MILHIEACTYDLPEILIMYRSTLLMHCYTINKFVFEHHTDLIHIGANKPNLTLLMKYRNSVAPYWRDLGLQLLQGEDTDMLNVIQANHPMKVQDCCDKMFQQWLAVDTEASWNKLIDALEHIHQNALAKKIREEVSKG